ncbi:MAG: PEP-CTERM sorting domain-containing protein [Fimbriimonadaceae bacterium]|nr:PEP-CTERM sorting domain-containing protein [Fimbriimonadaceae bacterium]
MKKLIFALSALTVVSSVHAVSYFDGEFAVADYGHFAYFDNAFTSTNNAAAGGNPNATLHHIIEHDPAGAAQGTGEIGSYNFNFLYNPSVSGALSSISFSADYYLDTEAVLSGQALFFSLIQDGSTYYVPVFDDYTPGQWLNASFNAMPNSAWRKLDWISGNFVFANPDFSAAGNEMMFGFITGYNLSNGALVTTRVDNFSVQTAPVPEPATMAVLGFGALAVGLRRRKKNRA